jgi:geranylgeranyl diphosphate synthase type II
MLKRQKLSFSSQADFLGILAIRQAAESGGFSGATEGQFLDLYENKLTFETLREVMHKKTVTLFEMAFTFGWLFGGGDPAKLQQIKKAAAHFGIAFQIADDLNDQESDRISGRKANIANLFGEEKAKEMFHVEQQGYLETLKELSIDSPQLQAVAALF